MKFKGKLIYLFLIFMLFASPLFAGSDDEDDDDAGNEFEVELVALNNSGVEATVEMVYKGHMLHVSVKASGLEANRPHPQHIHGHDAANVNATCPGIEADADGDGLISVMEGLPDYGPIVLPLTPFNLVDADGNLEYEAMFKVNPASLQPLHKRAIVLHGMTVNGTYIPSLPVACGQIEADD